MGRSWVRARSGKTFSSRVLWVDRVRARSGKTFSSRVLWVDRGFEHRPVKPKDYTIDICYLSAKPAGRSRNTKDWLVRNQNNVSEWSDMSTLRFSVCSARKHYKNQLQKRVDLVQSGYNRHIIEQ